MHTTSNHRSNPTYPAYPLVIWLGDDRVDMPCLGDFIGDRRRAASDLRRAELRQLIAAGGRRLRLLRSTLKWRLRMLSARINTVLRSQP
jgi:hypothetical protein